MERFPTDDPTPVEKGQPQAQPPPRPEPPVTALMVLAVLTCLSRNDRPRPGESKNLDNERAHLAIYRRLYHFQSRVLRIPDRVGVFYTPPPEEDEIQGEEHEDPRAFQGAMFAAVICVCVYIASGYLVLVALWLGFGLLDPVHDPRDLNFLIQVGSLTAGFMAVYGFGAWGLAVWGRGNIGQSSLEADGTRGVLMAGV